MDRKDLVPGKWVRLYIPGAYQNDPPTAYHGRIGKILETHHFTVTLEMEDGIETFAWHRNIDKVSYLFCECGNPIWEPDYLCSSCREEFEESLLM